MSERQRVLFLSHSHTFGAFRVGSHHYAREFARFGADVVHLSTPISRVHLALGRVGRNDDAAVPRGAHEDSDGVIHLVPRTTLPAPWGRFSVARALARHGIGTAFDAVVIDQPLLWDESVRGLSDRLVYRPTDLYLSGVKRRLQQKIAAAADGVVATSDEVLRGLGRIRRPSLVIGNGVDTSHFAPLTAGARQPVCVYVGALDARFDWAQVTGWARARPGIRFVIAGPSQEASPDLPANVELLGAVAYSALPVLLRDARVGLLPLSGDRLNAGRSPMKLYEYLAAGLAVVARATPVLHSDEGAGLFTYSGAGDAVEALDRALGHPSPNFAGEATAASEAWSTKAAQLAGFLHDLPRR